ncbi:MAG: ABC-F family ATP-binding cassette domain-containing protein [Vampirovibrionales bacterium]
MTITLTNVCKNFTSKSLFTNLNLQLDVTDRVGLIGRNGRGKSTLLKMIMGEMEPDEGSIKRTPGMRVSYLSQEPKITPHLSLEEDMRSVFSDLSDLHNKEHELLHLLAETPHDSNDYYAIADQLDRVHQALERYDEGTIDARIGKILNGLGFSLSDYQRKTGDFSGGWQMRINLAKVLLEGADFLLMDEPTNHLDLEAIEWLEDYLKTYPGGLVIVSHDQRFLDEICTSIAELDNKAVTTWSGNYSAYVAQKELFIEQQTAAYERQQKELAKQTAFVERFKASASRGTQAKSREKQLEKIERIERPTTGDGKTMKLSFPPITPSGKEVLTFSKLSKSYGDKHLFSHIEGKLLRQERVFILGGNGTGKTTLLQLLMNLEPADTGSVNWGHQVQLGYFSQHQLETLNPEKSAFDTLHDACPKMDHTEVRTLLGRFLLTGDQVFKPVKVLSGGEKSKLALAVLLVSGPNTLILDEPTNHMDIPSKNVLLEAFQAFEGTVLCISHDRNLIENLATDIWELVDGQLIAYGGDYRHYKAKRAQIHEALLGKKPSSASKMFVEAEPTKATVSVNRKTIEKQLKAIEKKIANTQKEMATIESTMANPDIQSDYAALTAATEQLAEKQDRLKELQAQWEQLNNQLT